MQSNSFWKNLKRSGNSCWQSNSFWQNLKRSGNQFVLEKFKTLWQSNSFWQNLKRSGNPIRSGNQIQFWLAYL
jgi:hypothetical protein